MDVEELSSCFKNFYHSETQFYQTYNLSIRTLAGKCFTIVFDHSRIRAKYFAEYVDNKCGVENINDDTDVNSQRILDYTRIVVSGWMTLFTTILGVLGNLLSIMTLLDR